MFLLVAHLVLQVSIWVSGIGRSFTVRYHCCLAQMYTPISIPVSNDNFPSVVSLCVAHGLCHLWALYYLRNGSRCSCTTLSFHGPAGRSLRYKVARSLIIYFCECSIAQGRTRGLLSHSLAILYVSRRRAVDLRTHLLEALPE